MGFVTVNDARTRWINDAAIKKAEAIDMIDGEGFVRSLRITYIDGEMEMWDGPSARDLWIALGLAEWITDGDGHALRLCTPFGERSVI